MERPHAPGLWSRLQRIVGQTLCRLSQHFYVIYSVGHNLGKECRRCQATGTITTAEWEQHRYVITWTNAD